MDRGGEPIVRIWRDECSKRETRGPVESGLGCGDGVEEEAMPRERRI